MTKYNESEVQDVKNESYETGYEAGKLAMTSRITAEITELKEEAEHSLALSCKRLTQLTEAKAYAVNLEAEIEEVKTALTKAHKTLSRIWSIQSPQGPLEQFEAELVVNTLKSIDLLLYKPFGPFLILKGKP